MAVRYEAAKQLPVQTRKVALRKIAREYDVGVQYPKQNAHKSNVRNFVTNFRFNVP